MGAPGLPLKNQLSALDCQAVEVGFVARLRELGDDAAANGSKTQEANAQEPGRERAEPAPAEVTVISKPVRERDRNHLRFVASQPCLVCGRSPSDPHHIKFAEQRAMGRKVSDRFTVPLCRLHHRELHRPRRRTRVVADPRDRSAGRCGKALGHDPYA